MKQRGPSRWARILFITIVLATGIAALKPLRAQNSSIESRLTEVEAKLKALEKDLPKDLLKEVEAKLEAFKQGPLTGVEAKIKAVDEANQNNYNFLQIIAGMGTVAGVFLVIAGFREASRLASLRKELVGQFDAVRDRQERKNNE